MNRKFSDPHRYPQYQCPAPRCQGKAAPVFGMVCTRHQDAPKKLVKEWRIARARRLKLVRQ